MIKLFFNIIIFMVMSANVFAGELEIKPSIDETDPNDRIVMIKLEEENPRIPLDTKTKQMAARMIVTENTVIIKENTVFEWITDFENLVDKQLSVISDFYGNPYYKPNKIKELYKKLLNMLFIHSQNCYNIPTSDYDKSDFKFCYQYNQKDKVDEYLERELSYLYRNILYKYFLYNIYQKYYDLKLYQNDKDLLNRLKNTDVYYSDIDKKYLFPIYHKVLNRRDIKVLKDNCNQNNIKDMNECYENILFKNIKSLVENEYVSDDEIKKLFNDFRDIIYEFIKTINPANMPDEELSELQEKAYNEFLAEYFWYDFLELREDLISSPNIVI